MVYMMLTSTAKRPHAMRFKKYGTCAYCNVHSKLTKEHVVPRCFGGVYKIYVCASCNNERGNKIDYEPFLNWVETHKEEFKKAILMSKDEVQTRRWLERGSKQCNLSVY